MHSIPSPSWILLLSWLQDYNGNELEHSCCLIFPLQDLFLCQRKCKILFTSAVKLTGFTCSGCMAIMGRYPEPAKLLWWRESLGLLSSHRRFQRDMILWFIFTSVCLKTPKKFSLLDHIHLSLSVSSRSYLPTWKKQVITNDYFAYPPDHRKDGCDPPR